jgi:glutamine amidotransferase
MNDNTVDAIAPLVAIIDAGGANFLSVIIALEKLGVRTIVTHEKADILAANAVLLPGVGSANFAMQKLTEYDLIETIKNLTKPLLGICLGMQLLYEHSDEGNVDCLGIIKGKVRKFNNKVLAVPHMGWNNLIKHSFDTNINANVVLNKNEDGILNNIGENSDVYFVHSFYAPVSGETIAKCTYGADFSAVVKYKNFHGMQFHPEKSGIVGEALLKNFVSIVYESYNKC